METPLPNDSLKASLSPPVGGCLRSFRRDWQKKQMFIQRVKHYHQWLCTVIPFKTKSGQIPSDSVRVQGLSKRLWLLIFSLFCQITQSKGWKMSNLSGFTVALPKVEASHRSKQAQHFSTRRKVQNGNSRVHQDLPDSRGMGIVDNRMLTFTSPSIQTQGNT